MKKQYVQGLTLPPDVAAEQEQKRQMQAQIASMRNGMALEIFSRATASRMNGFDTNELENSVNENRTGDISAMAAYALMSAMVFMETAGMIRREDGPMLQS
jgi:hypothetical protein